jgi:NAD(P)-dependent dehydrogenase (short-subunit alcohol dehydrogenase family)
LTTTYSGNILVTGASSGIGRACAVRFAELGYRIFAGVRKASDGDTVKAVARDRLEPVLLDVTCAESIAKAVAVAGEEPLAGLVNNAGIAVAGPLELVPLEALRRQFEVNVIGLVAVTQAFLPLLRRGRGRIINVGSIAGRCALPGSGPYDSSKSAVDAITDVLRMELSGWGISVSLIEAGAVATPIWEKSLREAEELKGRVGTERYALYEGLMEAVREEATQSARNAAPVGRIVRAVVHAMTARRPRTRYIAGNDTLVWRLLHLLPDRWRDKLILSKVPRPVN